MEWCFVADSQEERLDANLETMENLQEHLKEHNLNFDTIPYVLQLNKRDLPNAMSIDGSDETAAAQGRTGDGRCCGYRAGRV